jgi:hypothetical protein
MMQTFNVRRVVSAVYRTWENIYPTFSSSLGSTLLLIEKAAHDPLYLWDINDTRQLSEHGETFTMCAQTHYKEMLTWHSSGPLTSFSLPCTCRGHTEETLPYVSGGDTQQRFFTMVVAAVCGPPCVDTWQKVCRVLNHFRCVCLPHGKELVFR